MFQTIETALPLLLLPAIGIVMLLLKLRRRASPLAPPEVAADGTLSVPVRALFLRRAGIMGGFSGNSVNPRFAIAADGLRFKLFREGRLQFSDIEHIDVREWLGGQYLLFVGRNPRLLSVDVGDRAAAKRVLGALPRSIALTPEAATIRDGVPAAGTSRLSRYDGRFH
jgi:hypothetical protein